MQPLENTEELVRILHVETHAVVADVVASLVVPTAAPTSMTARAVRVNLIVFASRLTRTWRIIAVAPGRRQHADHDTQVTFGRGGALHRREESLIRRVEVLGIDLENTENFRRPRQQVVDDVEIPTPDVGDGCASASADSLRRSVVSARLRSVTSTNVTTICRGSPRSSKSAYAFTHAQRGGPASAGTIPMRQSHTGLRDEITRLTGYSVQAWASRLCAGNATRRPSRNSHKAGRAEVPIIRSRPDWHTARLRPANAR